VTFVIPTDVSAQNAFTDTLIRGKDHPVVMAEDVWTVNQNEQSQMTMIKENMVQKNNAHVADHIQNKGDYKFVMDKVTAYHVKSALSQIHTNDFFATECKNGPSYNPIAEGLLIFDAIGLAAFTAIGAEVALENNLDLAFVIITLALLTGTGGGILRDVFAKEIPFVFRKEIYAVASIIGAVCFIIIERFSGNNTVALYSCFGITLIIRLGCMKKDVHLKKVKKDSF
jgi:uncharacterized membrane protein YeiH